MSTSGNIRVSGGIISDQMLSGSVRHFTLEGADFTGTLSDGTVTIEMGYGELLPIDERTVVTLEEGAPVPNSAAEAALMEVMKKASIVMIGLGAEDAGSTVKVDFTLANTSMGWEMFSMVDGSVTETAVDAMTAAIQALGTVTTPTGDIDLSAATVTEKEFILV